MTKTNVFELTQPGTFSDPLTEVLRNGARTLLGQAVEAEVAAWLSAPAKAEGASDAGGGADAAFTTPWASGKFGASCPKFP